MSSSQMKLAEQISLYFFQAPGVEVEDCGDEMKMAFQDCLEVGLNPKWVSEEEVINFKDKTDVIIFEKFEGKVFNELKKQKCVRICGPRCIRICLSENSQIPETNSPIFMTAMRDLVVTATNVDSNIKMKLKEKVSYMGGFYSNNLIESVTHVVCGHVRSIKYDKAVERGLSLMSVEWVDAVWTEGLKRNVHAASSEFQKYKCPVFLNLEITTSNFSTSEKNKLKDIINSNGGVYCNQLKQNSTAILIINSNPSTSDKYKHARSWNLPCLKSSWIYESLRKGYLVSSEQHLLTNAIRCSTPTENKEELPSFTGSDVSMVSSVGFHGISGNRSNIDETVLTNITVPYVSSAPRDKSVKSSSTDQGHKKIVESLNLVDAKKAGPFLDGCKVYLSGFTAQEQDKLRRILNVGGAVIFTELTDAVSHVIAGDFVAADGIWISKAVNRPNVVGIEWLVASLKLGSPALESLYSRMESTSNKQIPPEPPSPLSQKGLQLLKKGEFKTPPSVRSLDRKKENEPNQPAPSENTNSDSGSIIHPVNRNLFQDFVKSGAAESTSKSSGIQEKGEQPMNIDNDENVNNVDDLSTTQGPTDIFNGLVFMILGFDRDITAEVDEAIVNYGGSVVAQSFKGMTDYTVVPLNGVPMTGIQSEVVTIYWLDDCCESRSVVPIQYYHQPLSIAGNRTPLEGCVITLSIYSLRERKFLSELVVALGALCQEIFARKTNVDKGVHGNTHLVIPTSGSSKYNAAVKWNIPVVTKDWLLACAKLGSRAPEQPYLVTSKDETSSENSSHQAVETPQREAMVSALPIRNSVTPKRPNPFENNEPTSNETPNDTTPANTINNQAASTSYNTLVRNILLPGDVLKTGELSENGDFNNDNFNSRKVRKLSVNSTPVRNYEGISTPETPYEEAFGENGKTARKKIKRWINHIEAAKARDPVRIMTPPPRRNSTPLSELMRKAFQKFGNTPDSSTDVEENENSKEEATLGAPGIEDEENQEPPTSNNSTPPPSFSTILNEKLAQLKKQISTNPKVPSVIPTRISSGSSKDLTEVENGSTSSGSNTRLNPNYDSQVNQVGWEEPVEVAEKAKILGVVPDSTPENKKFVISNVQDSKKEDYIKMIASLGATLLSSDRYSFETTHLLTDRPIRSEKLLCSIAAGRWVLHVSYLEESYKANTFLPEEDFEWGNPRSKENLPPLKTEKEINLANAAFRWRSSSQQFGCNSGPFNGMKAVMFINNKRLVENLSRLILAGKGLIFDMKDIMEATHCFMQADDYEGIDFKALASKNIYCLRPIYLGNYLTEDPTPDPMENTIDEYRKFCG